jgi:hypothetical protein
LLAPFVGAWPSVAQQANISSSELLAPEVVEKVLDAYCMREGTATAIAGETKVLPLHEFRALLNMSRSSAVRARRFAPR